ncbi:uncharacterized protein PAC_13449 [Phialocephala subalpina]|uniref:Uncharacterized protein n=1 Tax=Phialocephala subalpina TaxID=576137 RepID=A0A1L7XEU3_9HELO|nr:uncharacterized protein PAC_13449 [Phialocephala subalpina]
MSSLTPIDDLFHEARDGFLNSLSETEKKHVPKCTSAEEFISSISKLDLLTKRGRRGVSLLKKLQKFSDSLSPYFHIIEVFCSAHPEFACLAWGALSLLLQLASNFSNFFEKVCDLLESLNAILPQFRDVYNSLNHMKSDLTPRLHEAILQFYTCLFEFFQTLARVFTNKNGTIRRTPATLADLFWRPFDVRFQAVVKRIRICQGIVKSELDVALILAIRTDINLEREQLSQNTEDVRHMLKEVENMRLGYDEMQRDWFRSKVLQWLSPPPFKSAFEQAQYSREEGTAQWLYQEPIFQSWHRNSVTKQSSPSAVVHRDQILWMNGNPGSGKTVLAASTIEELQSPDSTNNGEVPIVCYYFFEAASPHGTTRLAAYRALATQLFQQGHVLESIRDVFAFAGNSVREPASENELLDTLKLSLDILQEVYFVVDGVDECEENARVFDDLYHLCEVSTLKVIFFSRPNVACIRRSKYHLQTIAIDQSKQGKDMGLFFDRELQDLQESDLLPKGVDLASIRGQLIERADGMFLWGRLMMKYLNSPALTAKARLDVVRETNPDGIDEMYWRIFKILGTQDQASQQLARTVFLWCLHAYHNLDDSQLQDALYGHSESEENRIVDIDHAVIVSCCGLIEKRLDRTFHFIHLTAREFMDHNRLVSPRGVVFNPSSWEGHSEIASTSMKYLIYSIPVRPLSGDLKERASAPALKIQYPFLGYATLNWLTHLAGSMKRREIPWSAHEMTSLTSCFDLLRKLLSLPLNLMVWIEALYTFASDVLQNSPFQIMKARIREMDAVCELWHTVSGTSTSGYTDLIADLQAFAVDIHKMDLGWCSTLAQRPHEIWNDVTVFSQSRFFVTTGAVQKQNLAATAHGQGTPLRPRFSMSATSVDATQLSVVSVWPCREFEMLWMEIGKFQDLLSKHFTQVDTSQAFDQSHVDATLLACLSSGWTAQYEVYSIREENTRLGTVNIPLKPEEVAQQIRQSLRRSVLGSWKLNFPIAMSSDHTHLAILRSIFVLKMSRESNANFNITVSAPLLLQVDYRERTTNCWSDQRPFFGLPYLYSTLLSCDNRYLIFKDHDLGSGGGEACSMALYPCDFGSGARTCQAIINFEYSDAGGYDIWTLHNQMPRLIFTASRAIMLWELSDGILLFRLNFGRS